ncbi:MAG TPA: DUF6298 domain-containing protein [Verrucomicrobiae bacterium]
MKRIPLLIFLGMVLVADAAPKGPPPIISVGTNGFLLYDADERGNRVPDFSNCGYAGGDRQIPDAPVRVVVSPVKGDETARIQRAIDYVASQPADSNGVHGAVLLLKGRHEVLGGLQINASGIVLRGQGMGEDGTILIAASQDRRTLVTIAGRNDRKSRANDGWQIKDDYVLVGATSFHLKDASGLKVGDTINVIRPCTQAWIDRLGATDFGGGEGGGWKPGSRDLVWDRVVKSIEGDLVTVDAPITTAIENPNLGRRRGDESQTENKEKLESPYVVSYNWPGRISNVGIENLRLESTFDASNAKDENHSWCAITMENAVDGWVRQVTFKHFAGSAVAIYESCKQVTVEDCLSLAPVSEDGGYRRNTFFTMGQLTLFLRCFAENGRHDFSVGHCAAGPNAFVQCEASLPSADSGAIESWASGTLFDNVRIDGNGLNLAYRGANGQGAGWSAANSVLWNCSASKIICANPPTAQNWAFGSWAEFDGDGVWRNSNGFMKPESLYAAQLAERLGRRVQLISRSAKESTNPTVEEAAELIAASRKPAPQLVDYIAAASTRNPIPSEPGDAINVGQASRLPSERVSASEEKAAPTSSARAGETPALRYGARKPILITNGWITCDGKLLIGDSLSVAWWRGNVRPSEAPTFEPALTRFVPGRIGRGFTDDLGELADAMQANNQVALDQHYGLWYERRRDDHERIRRMTGDVWPPFYEQPFARSGQGTAWDGLSKYDLTKFNPWYWGRLKEFADVCDERGLVLFNENYFQHNIIEAGAHWVDCPWRTANNINETGFPEPPPFAGDKRIFMAEQFYDETNPVRRALHRGFIRQNLDNFTDNANVIQFISAEFSGPLHFTQFWLDTIGEWERQNKRSKPIIALAAPKDVQDAILADAKRAAVVDIIAFRYWWITDKGTYAPNGGLNLAPRQFQRQWKGGTPSDMNLATMAAGYRAKFPAKPVIAASEQGADLSRCGWAYLCAGGSIPNLPRTTDAKLLAAIPRMQPWGESSKDGRWVLREAGKQFLIYSGADSEIDLSHESGSFRVSVVNPRTGEVTPGETVKAGSKVKLPNATVVWLTKEK